ncbi:ABC transporter substrate-binding protein [Sharpea azabuensis]|uniref:ABC transporter substrate-binding protein n=1 Tax=Sharpea azabuensis TaxID=322505 RepID=UPI002E81F12B|nr:ABC transporter substrate-binding protein [Sharpea azabuensis]MEE3308193.1 ABC transporter substrate-binding protein [Sharpea azabuensis]
MKFKKVLAIAACASMLVGCGGNATKSTSNGTVKAPKFGFIGPLTGDASQYGTAVKNALQLAIKQYNSKHGTKIKAYYYDDKADATEAVNAYNKLVNDDKVTAVLSPVTTASAIAVAKAASKNGTPILAPSASGDSFTIDPSTKKAYPNVFRICTNDSYAGTYLAELCNTKFHYKNVAALYNKELDYSTGLYNAFKVESKNQNVNVVYAGAYNANTKDFSTFVQKVKDSKADAVYLPDYYESVVAIAKQLRDAGVNVPLFGGDGWDGVLDVKGVNAANFEDTYFVSGFNKDATSGPAKEFVDAYKAEYNATPNMFAAMEYDALNVMMKVINEVKSTDSKKITDALAKVDVKSDEAACGGFKYNKDHNPQKKMSVVTVKAGKYVTVQ